MRLRRTTRLASAAALASALLLSACTGGGSDPGPTGTTPPSTTAATAAITTSQTSPPATSSPAKNTPPVDPVLAKIPKAARPETRQGAESFARFYIEQLNRAYTEPDPAALEGLDDQDCQLCQVFHSSAEKFERQGLKYESAAFRTESSVAKVFTTSSRIIELSAIQKRVNIVDKRGVVNSTTVAAKALLRFTLRFQGHWIASRIQGVS